MKNRNKYMYVAPASGKTSQKTESALLPGDDIERDPEMLHSKEAAVFRAVDDLLAYSGADGCHLLAFRLKGPLHNIIVGSREAMPTLLLALDEPDKTNLQ